MVLVVAVAMRFGGHEGAATVDLSHLIGPRSDALFMHNFRLKLPLAVNKSFVQKFEVHAKPISCMQRWPRAVASATAYCRSRAALLADVAYLDTPGGVWL